MNRRWTETVAIRVIVALTVAVLVPLITDFATRRNGKPIFTAYETVILGAVIFLITISVSIAHEVHQVLQIRVDAQRTARAESEVDVALYNARSSYSQMLASREVSTNLLARYYSGAIIELAEELHGAVEHREVMVGIKTFEITELLLTIIAKRHRDTIRLVALLPGPSGASQYVVWTKSYFSRAD